MKAETAADMRRAFNEAEEGYRQALAVLVALHESPQRDTREMELMTALVPLLYATKGFGAPDTVVFLARARALAEKGGKLLELILQLMANFSTVWVAGDLP